jgi:hypothetical protein
MKKAYFQYYETFEIILEKIQSIEQRDSLRRAIISYGLYGTTPENLTEVEDIVFTICRDLIDQQRHRCEVNTQNACKTTTPAGMKKPTLKEIADYCKEKGYAINAAHFYNYYEANGWKVGRNSMKSWKAALANWNTRDKAAGTAWTTADTKTEQYANAFN